MKGKLIFNYFISFIAACTVILLVNIIIVRENVYNQDTWYDYKPESLIEEFRDYIYLSEDKKIMISNEGVKSLESENAGLQVIDKNNNEVFNYKKPDFAPSEYSNVSLIDVYTSKLKTMFLDELVLGGESYTYLLFLDANKVNRISYSYDIKSLRRAHNFPMLIGINIILILLMSFLFTLKIIRPINRIIDKIINLSNGKYSKDDVDKGLYFKVETCLSDLTQRLISSEKERKKVEKMKEDWISNITHDIKTPLTSIIGNAEILADTEYEVEDATRKRYCKTIIVKSEYIKTLIEDLNLSTRLKNNDLVLNKKRVNIVSLVRHVLIDILNDEKYNHNNISFEYSSEEIFLELDEQLVKRVFVNLIINAFIHNDDGVKVSIKIEKINEKVRIYIKDDGRGISKSDINNIFKRYYRGTNTRKKTEGSGLGMAIAHDVIKAHKGNIIASSEETGGLNIKIIFV